jgi:hypothetical protein
MLRSVFVIYCRYTNSKCHEYEKVLNEPIRCELCLKDIQHGDSDEDRRK